MILFLLAFIFIYCNNPAPETRKAAELKTQPSWLPDTTRHFPENLTASYNLFWNRLHQRAHYSGVSLLYSKGKFYEWHAGFADSGILLNSHQPMQIASISKTFCAASVMILINRGKLKLNDSLRRFFPELPYYNISIEQLLSHSSGLPEYTWFTDGLWKDSLRLTNDSLIALMAREKPEPYYKPGRRHRYTNTNFTLLASIVEKVSGNPYPDFLKENIFNPLGMMDTRVLSNTQNWDSLEVKGHYGTGKPIEFHFQDGTWGDKNIVSTVWDLFIFYRGLKNNKLFPPVYRNEMFEARWPNARRGTGYGLGWRIRKYEDEVWMFHSGWWHGFRTNLYFNIERDECAVILANRLSGGFIPGNTIVAMFHPNDWFKLLHITDPGATNSNGEED